MSYSVFSSPNPILFGRGTSSQLGDRLKGFGCSKVLVIYDKGIKAAGVADKVLDVIKAAGIGTVTFDKVEADPPDYLVHEAAALGVAEKVDGIVGIGGGSSIDSAKATRILLTNPPPISKYASRHVGDIEVPGTPIDESLLKPLVVIPTTAGTGSEGSPGAIITDTEHSRKFAVLSTLELAIVDPELATGLPPFVTATTGFDAFCHACELITSRIPNKFSEVFGKEAIRLITKYLPIACKDGANIEAREAMSLAASMCGVALRGPFGGIPHDIGMCLGATYHAAHGATVGCLTAENMKYIAPVVPDKLRIIAESMGVDIKADATPEEIGEILCAAVRKLYWEVNMPPMRTFVKSREDLIENVDNLFKSASYTSRELTREAALEILTNSYDNN